MRCGAGRLACCATLFLTWSEHLSSSVASEKVTDKNFFNKVGSNENRIRIKEEESYWERLLQESMSMVPPTDVPPTGEPPTRPPPPPTEQPAPPPTARPTEPPTAFPTRRPTPPPPTARPTEPPTQPPPTARPTEPPTQPPPTARPTEPPTQPPPTARPTEPPTQPPPTARPTEPPVPPPTRRPTEPPTISPTPPPFPDPTPAPVPPPSPPPNPPPTIAEECLVDVTVTCVGIGDADCNLLVPPSGICSDGSSISIVRFEYTGFNCDAGNCNSQQNDYTCEDTNGGPPGDEEVLVTCADGDSVLVSETVIPGDAMTVPSGDGTSPLPTSITCTVTSTDEMTTYQTLTLNTSGEVDLYLGNKFGSLKINACDDQDCVEAVTYFYLLENIGTTPMTITVVDRTRNGVTDSLLDQLPTTELDVGANTVITEMDTIDICVDAKVNTTITAEADPPAGSPCFDSDLYCLQTEGPCLVDAKVVCRQDGTGMECNDIPPPNQQCATGEPVSTVSFVYKECSCEEEDNNQGDFSSCVDEETCELGSTVDITCGDDFFAGVETGGVITLSTGEDVLSEITCQLAPAGGVICQTVKINTSGAIDLQLKDKFGSLELVSCDENDCLTDVTYEYSIRNIGQTDMTINFADITFKDNDPVSILDQFTKLTLVPNETVSVTEEQVVDLCISGECVTCLDVDANAPGGSICEDKDFYTLEIDLPPTPPLTLPPTPPPPTPAAVTPPPTPPPTPLPPTSPPPPTTPPTMAPTEECDITIEVGCVPLEGGTNATSCEQLPPLVTICEERATWMQFKYYGGDCSQSANMQTEKFFCTDFAEIPASAPVYIEALDTKDAGTIFFAGEVPLDGLYNVTDPSGNRLPADMNLTIYDTQGGTLLQRVQYHSSCSQNLFLKDRYGASQLVAFFNSVQGLVDCFITSNYTFTIENNGTLPAVLDSLVALTTPFGPFDLTEDVLNQTLAVGEMFVVYLPIEIDLTVRQRYTVLATITGTFSGEEPCSSSDFLDFIAGNALAPSVPTLAPSQMPATPAPTPDPLTSACELMAGIKCEVTEGSVSSCDDLAFPTGQCLSTPSRLDFIFSGGTCSESTNTAEDFDCMDENGGIGDRESVFIVMAKDETFFEGEVRRGQIVSAVGEFENDMTVTITDAETGDELQVMEIRTECAAEDDLTLLETFGGLQLVAFENADEFESIFANLRITYTVENPSIKARINEAIATSSTSGEQGFPTPFDLEYQGSREFPADEIFINLAESASFDFSFDVRAEGLESEMACAAEAMLRISTSA